MVRQTDDHFPQIVRGGEVSHEALIERLRKRAAEDRECAKNNAITAALLAPQLEAFDRRDGSHNTYAVRLMLDHRNGAEKDAQYADDLDAVIALLVGVGPERVNAFEEAALIAEKWRDENRAAAAKARTRESRMAGLGVDHPGMAEMLDGAAIECNAIAGAIRELKTIAKARGAS